MKRFAARLALVAGTLVVLLTILEIGLRVASGFVERERGGARGIRTILCVGDSHTFGLHVPPHLSYPALLQRELDPAARQTGVVNYGVPGRNSAALLRQLPSYLETVRPDLVLILVGFNDTWNVDGVDAGGDTHANADPSWIQELRVVKLARLIRLNLAGDTRGAAPRIFERDGRMMIEEDGVVRPAATGGRAFGTLEGPALCAQVAGNVERIVALVRARGATPLLVGYATENQPYFIELNANARGLASRIGCEFIETAIPFRDVIARDGYATWFFSDDHPNARGNELFAKLIADALIARGLASRTEGDPTAAVSNATARIERGGTSSEFVILGPPTREFQVAFSTRTAPALEFQGVVLPIADDPMLRRCLEDLNLRGRTDAAGRANLVVNFARLGAESGVTLHGVVVFFDSSRHTGIGALSPAITFVVP